MKSQNHLLACQDVPRRTKKKLEKRTKTYQEQVGKDVPRRTKKHVGKDVQRRTKTKVGQDVPRRTKTNV